MKIEELMIKLRGAVANKDEKLAAEVGIELLGLFMSTLDRIATALEKNNAA